MEAAHELGGDDSSSSEAEEDEDEARRNGQCKKDGEPGEEPLVDDFDVDRRLSAERTLRCRLGAGSVLGVGWDEDAGALNVYVRDTNCGDTFVISTSKYPNKGQYKLTKSNGCNGLT